MKKLIVVVLTVGSLLAGGKVKAQDMNVLDSKQKKIVTIAASTAVGDLETLKTELAAGLEAGLTVNQIKEVLVQMYAYCGFPRSLQGLNTFMGVIAERERRGIVDTQGPQASPVTAAGDKYALGKANLQQLTGVAEGAPAGANAFAPAIDVFLKEHLFADIFERDVLSFRERETATISALAAMQGVEPMLKSHIGMGRNTGLSDEQVQTILSVAAQIGSDFRSAFSSGSRGSSEWFTGVVHVEGLLSPDEMENLYSVGQVTFMPGGRTHWHTHPIGQTLLVLDGQGWYQERGKPARELTKGSVVAIPKDVEHWHGAAADTKLVHIAISNVHEGSAVTWMTAVTEEEYEEVSKQ